MFRYPRIYTGWSFRTNLKFALDVTISWWENYPFPFGLHSLNCKWRLKKYVWMIQNIHEIDLQFDTISVLSNSNQCTLYARWRVIGTGRYSRMFRTIAGYLRCWMCIVCSPHNSSLNQRGLDKTLHQVFLGLPVTWANFEIWPSIIRRLC